MLSGFQFVGIILEKNLSLTESNEMALAYFMLSVGFLISMFGVLISFVTLEYLRGCRDENIEFIVAGIQKYKWIFKKCGYNIIFRLYNIYSTDKFIDI